MAVIKSNCATSYSTNEALEPIAFSTVDAPKNSNHRWWWERTAPLLESLLFSSAGYTPEQVAGHLQVYRDVVIPTFGPPTPGAQAVPILCADGSPMEPSWNFQANSSSIIRYAFEPLGDKAGTDEDPFAQAFALKIMPSIAALCKNADLGWFHQITQEWFLSPEETQTARAALPSGLKRLPQLFLAFDMHGADRLLKAYLFPVLKHLATGQTTKDLVLNLIPKLSPHGSDFVPLLNRLNAYLSTRQDAGQTPLIQMIAIDCVESSSARIKIYGRTQANSMACAADVMTLGGLQTDPTTLRGVECMRKIWPLLLDETAAGLVDTQCKEPRRQDTLHKGVCFTFELRPRARRVEVKAHVPVPQTMASDWVAVRRFGAALREFGWDEAARKFEEGLGRTGEIPGRNYDGVGALTYMSYIYNENGPYMTCYLSTQTRTPQD